MALRGTHQEPKSRPERNMRPHRNLFKRIPAYQNEEGKSTWLSGSNTKTGQVKALISHFHQWRWHSVSRCRFQYAKDCIGLTMVVLNSKSPNNTNGRAIVQFFALGFEVACGSKASYLRIWCLYQDTYVENQGHIHRITKSLCVCILLLVVQ